MDNHSDDFSSEGPEKYKCKPKYKYLEGDLFLVIMNKMEYLQAINVSK